MNTEQTKEEIQVREQSERLNPYAKECPNRHLWSEGYRKGAIASQSQPKEEAVGLEHLFKWAFDMGAKWESGDWADDKKERPTLTMYFKTNSLKQK